MIQYFKKILSNGLTVIVHSNANTPLATFNILYDVGSRDENQNQTGIAHLFEHLMFEGSKNIPKFDAHVQDVGGINNAFTSKDVTNYYITLPAINIETAFWLESDRMNQLEFSEKSLEIQKNVVSEEYRQSYLNKPYGDWLLYMSPLAYKVHPYRWNPIGMDISHIEKFQLDDIKNFFYTHYRPNRAIICISGNVDPEEMFKLAQKWFGDISPNYDYVRSLPVEPVQTNERTQCVYRNVPTHAIYKAYHMVDRKNQNYYAYDILANLLANGTSSRLYQNLFKKQGLFNEITSDISGSIDNGLFYIIGKLAENITIEQANDSIENEVNKLIDEKVSEIELEKVINKIISVIMYSKMNISNIAMNLCYYDYLGDISLINHEIELYRNVTSKQIQEISYQMFNRSNSATLYYLSEKN